MNIIESILFNDYNKKLNKKNMKRKKLQLIGAIGVILLSSSSFAQTNVFDDIIATSPNHTYLEAAILQEGLQGALQNPSANLTVFAPTDQAFTDLANALGTDINGLLALPNLDDILLYHVLGVTVPSSAVNNGAIVQPLSPTNSLKLTVTTAGGVFVNQAQVSTADLTSMNGVVHVLDAVVLPSTTVADIAIGSPAHTTLVAAVVEARLLPALTDPFASLTVFAPTNAAFDDLAAALGTDLNGILALPELADILTYHVVAGAVMSTDLTDGPVATVNGTNIFVSLGAGVVINDANVTLADVSADNGVVHVLDKVLLPSFAGIEEGTVNQNSVYPNPTEDQIFISGIEDGNYSVIDLNGKVLLNGTFSSTQAIDMSNVQSGTYLMKMDDASGTRTVQIIKK